MTIAPLAALGIANTAFSLIRSLTASAASPKAHASAPVPSPWHAVARRLDVRAATPAELAQAAQALCDAGVITVEQCATLSQDLAAGAGGLRTHADAAGRVDWVAEFEARRAHAKAQGNSLMTDRLESALGVLQRLAAARRGPVYAVA